VQPANLNHNQFAYSVSEIAGALKRVVEDNFGHVRVRGEISGLKVAASGHAYLTLKDQDAVLDAVCWKGNISRFKFKPEDGLEVICAGRITTYPGRSKYQIVIDHMEPAGAGALMALLEARKKKLADEGLFDPKRKKPLPFLPEVIGIVTSPTGAVIRDILHRLSDRFPRHVLVWPVLVQGEGAAEQIAAAIRGFNALDATRSIPRPDLLIVARGGGSLEDLWSFNEEIVARAAAESQIPLISAVGHETDTTLIDFVSDKRAPTPTAAAEMAVPVRDEWRATLLLFSQRMLTGITRSLQHRSSHLEGLARGLPKPAQLLETAAQRFDDWSERLKLSLPMLLQRKQQQLAVASASLRPQLLMKDVERHARELQQFGQRMQQGFILRQRELERGQKEMEQWSVRLTQSFQNYLDKRGQRLSALAQLLESLNYTKVLERGYAMVTDDMHQLVSSAKKIVSGKSYTLTLRDGSAAVKAE